MNLTDAFSHYGAELKNVQWSVSAENSRGELVLSLWFHHFEKPQGNRIRYRDSARRWGGPGNAEFRRNIDKAFNTGQILRVVIARAEDAGAVERGEDASGIKKRFSIKDDWYGKVLAWNGEDVELEFEDRSRQPA